MPDPTAMIKSNDLNPFKIPCAPKPSQPPKHGSKATVKKIDRTHEFWKDTSNLEKLDNIEDGTKNFIISLIAKALRTCMYYVAYKKEVGKIDESSELSEDKDDNIWETGKKLMSHDFLLREEIKPKPAKKNKSSSWR